MEPLDWVCLFFGEQCIVQTFQLLLTQGNQTLEELHHLCVVAHESSLLFALTSEGLTPFASHREYTIPFARMNVQQLQTLRRLCKEQSEDAMKLNYGVDFYIVSTTTTERKIDDALMIFAAVCIMSAGLCSQKLNKHGYNGTRLDADILAYHVNAAVFKIVHSCSLRGGVQQKARQLLLKHQVV